MEQKMIYGIKKGTKVKFTVYSELGTYSAIGIVLGGEKEARKMFPEECADARGVYLVKVDDKYGNRQLHVIFPPDIISKEE